MLSVFRGENTHLLHHLVFIDTGHDGTVHSASWSHDSRWLLSTSADKTACVWAMGSKEPLLSFTSSLHNFKEQESSAKPPTARESPLFAKEITGGQFYYLDKFILLTSGRTLFLYKYHIDTSKPDDIKRSASLTPLALPVLQSTVP